MTPQPVLRRCVACRQLRDRNELWRVIRQASGGVVLDAGMGRSAYLCPSPSCLEEALRRKRLQRGLRCNVPASVLEALDRRLHVGGAPASEAR